MLASLCGARYFYNLIYRPVLVALCGPATFIACSIVLCLPLYVDLLLYSLLACPVLADLCEPALFMSCFLVMSFLFVLSLIFSVIDI